MNFTVFELLKIIFITQFYGLLLPGEMSTGLVKWHKLTKDNKMHAQGVACIVLTRTLHTLSLAILGVTFYLIELPFKSTPILISLIIGLIISIVLYLSMTNSTTSSFLENTINHYYPFKTPSIIKEKLSKLWNSIKLFTEMSFPKLNYALFLSFVSHLAGIFSICCIMLSLNINIPIISVIWIRAAVIFLQLLPISISGLGVREGAFVFLLKNYNVPSSEAMALSLIIFGMVLIMALIGGMWEAEEFLFKRRKK